MGCYVPRGAGPSRGTCQELPHPATQLDARYLTAHPGNPSSAAAHRLLRPFPAPLPRPASPPAARRAAAWPPLPVLARRPPALAACTRSGRAAVVICAAPACPRARHSPRALSPTAPRRMVLTRAAAPQQTLSAPLSLAAGASKLLLRARDQARRALPRARRLPPASPAPLRRPAATACVRRRGEHDAEHGHVIQDGRHERQHRRRG